MSMTLNEYQDGAAKTAVYPVIGHPIIYPVIGLAGEAGEICEKVKKLFRDGEGEITPMFRAALKKELGDQLWYLSEIARVAKLTLEEVAVGNLLKLADRAARGVLKGEGDDR